MKKSLFLSALICAAAIFGCNKDKNSDTNPDTEITNPTGQVNADSLSSAITVGYGAKVTGTFPVATTTANTPVLESQSNDAYYVVRNRYLIIHPSAVSGDITGYYVQINGAASYFKVDYTKASGLRKSLGKKTGFRTAGGAIDSTIVIKLPATMSGDTFYVKYAAYDTQNNVSAAITALVKILPQGGEAFTDSLSFKWRYLGQKYAVADTFEIDTARSTGYGYYTCSNDTLKFASYDKVTDLYLPEYKYNYNETITFAKYTWTDSYVDTYYFLQIDKSTCSNYVYSNQVDTGTDVGGYSFDSKTRMLTMVYDDPSSDELDYGTFYVNELTSANLILSMTEDGETRYIKLVK